MKSVLPIPQDVETAFEKFASEYTVDYADSDEAKEGYRTRSNILAVMRFIHAAEESMHVDFSVYISDSFLSLDIYSHSRLHSEMPPLRYIIDTMYGEVYDRTFPLLRGQIDTINESIEKLQALGEEIPGFRRNGRIHYPERVELVFGKKRECRIGDKKHTSHGVLKVKVICYTRKDVTVEDQTFIDGMGSTNTIHTALLLKLKRLENNHSL